MSLGNSYRSLFCWSSGGALKLNFNVQSQRWTGVEAHWELHFEQADGTCVNWSWPLWTNMPTGLTDMCQTWGNSVFTDFQKWFWQVTATRPRTRTSSMTSDMWCHPPRLVIGLWWFAVWFVEVWRQCHLLFIFLTFGLKWDTWRQSIMTTAHK